MKKALFPLFLTFVAAARLSADDVALISLRVAKENRQRQFAIEFYPTDAPQTVANFQKLARKGFYKGTAVHRAFGHTLVQMGDPLSKKKDRSTVGTGGPGYTIPPEIRRKHVICLEPMPNLDGQYTVFGKVIWGFETLDLISTKSVDSNDNPIERIEIRSVKILPRERLPAPPPPEKPGTAPAKPAKKPWWKIFG